jgi:hypothetical protein
MKGRAPDNDASVRRITRANPHGIRKMASSVHKTAGVAHKVASGAREGAIRALMPGDLATHEYFFLEHELDPETYPLDHSWMAQEKIWFERQQQKDNLMALPTEKTSTYLDGKGNRKYDDRYDMVVRKPPFGDKHPKILAAEKDDTWNPALEKFYEYLDPKARIPIAGIPSEPAFQDRQSKPAPKQRQIDPEWFQGAADLDEADFVRCARVSATTAACALEAITGSKWTLE